MYGLISQRIGVLFPMYSYINPIFLTRLLKSYVVDINRAWNISPKKMKEFQDKAFKKVIKYAYTVPLYHKKYKEAGINPNDIQGIKDIKKLPFITKNDLRENYPNGIIPKDFDKEHAYLLSTSGSSGKPLFCYYDFYSALKYIEAYTRILRAYGGSWNKSRVALVIDNKPGTVEYASFQGSVTPFLKKFMKLDNIKHLYVGEKMEKIVRELNAFDPEYIGSDPHTYLELAYHKNNGKCQNINPIYLFSSGAMLDSYTRQYVEKAFKTRIMDNYGSTEGGPMAFECFKCNGYHVNSDYCYLEFLDEKNNDVDYGTQGRLVVTRLYGHGTPIIRYTGLEDFATPAEPNHDCQLTSIQKIKNIGGRSIETIRLPSGRIIAPFHITTIPAKIMDELNTYKIKQFQIIQHKIDKIEILIVIDEHLRNVGPPVKKIIDELYNRFRKKIGPGVEITIKEVKEIPKDKDINFVRIVISKLKKP
jgi:phenylacetate-CoA ligase